MLSVEQICEILLISFGINWNEKFKKVDGKLKFELLNENEKLNVRLNLVEFIENNFNIIERCKIYKNHFIFSRHLNMSELIRNNVLMKVFMRFVEISSDVEEEAFLEITEKFIRDYGHVENLFFWKDQCENLLQNCSEKDEFFLNKFKNDIMSRILRGSLSGSRANDLEKIKLSKNIWINDDKYKNELREILIKAKICISFFFNYSKEEFLELKNDIIEIFKSNKLQLLEFFEYQKAIDLILDEDKFIRFEKFLSDFDNEETKIAFMRKILNFDFNGYLFTNPMKNGKECFIRLIDLLLYDVENYDELRKYLFRRDIFLEPKISIILSNMTKEIYL